MKIKNSDPEHGHNMLYKVIPAILLGIIVTTFPLQGLHGAEQYKLLILTPEEFEWPLVFFSLHKENTGIHTLLKTIEEIDADPAYAQGRDIQEKIKLAILNLHETNGIKYVMLVGDADKFPVRYTRVWDFLHFGHAYMPSDLYYADLYNGVDKDTWDDPDTGTFDSWDRNQNGFIGEMGRKDGEARNWAELNVDKVDMKPDVAVGRIPVSDGTELSNYLLKIVNYESNSYNQDWTKRILLVSGDWVDPAMEFTHILELMIGTGYSFRIYTQALWDNFTLPERYELLSQVINSGFEFVTYIGHGSSSEWQDWYNNESIRTLLTNENKLPVIFAGACDTGMFHFPDGPYVTKEGGLYYCPTDNEAYTGDATFTWTSQPDKTITLKSYNYPEYGITKVDENLILEKGKADRFKVLAPQIPRSYFSEYWRSIRSFNFPDRYLRHHEFRGKLTPITTQIDKLDSTFRIVPGLASSSIRETYRYISFESYNYPGWYLTDKDGVLVLSYRVLCDVNFDKAATFKQVQGLADKTACSFESFINSGWYIRHRDYLFYVESGSGDLFQKDVTFRLEVPTYDPYPDFRSIQYAGTNQFIVYQSDPYTHQYYLVCKELKDDLDKAASTFKLLPGLAEPGNPVNISLEALNPEVIQRSLKSYRSRPMFFLKHSDFKIRADEHRPINWRDRPEPAALANWEYTIDSMAEEFLVKSKNGAIAYVGCCTGAQGWVNNFIVRFYEEYVEMNQPVILGDLWKDAVKRYIQVDFPLIDGYLAIEDLSAATLFNTPNKMMFFGDPSLRIGGVPE